MSLTVLTDSNVRAVLHSLTREDILELQQSLADALHFYSSSVEEDNGCCSTYQPQRTSLKRTDGQTTLLMPASSNSGLGVKVITVGAVAETAGVQDPESTSLGSSDRTQSPRSSISAKSSTSVTVDGSSASTASASNTTPRGSLTLFDSNGAPAALINAEELTAFRTALASTLLLKKRQNVHHVTVFGAGKQAYWHIRLALLLRGSEIHHVDVINRSFDRARSMLMQLYYPFPDDPDYVNPIGHKYNSKTKTSILTPSHSEYTRLLKEHVRNANVIFCTTPATQPLFPASYLTNPEGRKKGRYISLIGSYKPNMTELHPDVLKQAVAPHHEHRHFHKHQREGGAIVVDSVEACLRESGEVIQAKLAPEQVVELGELLMLKREAEKRAREGKSKDGDSSGVQVQESSGLYEWLTKGNVIYKSVGIGLMDVVVGGDIVKLAQKRSIGTTIDGF